MFTVTGVGGMRPILVALLSDSVDRLFGEWRAAGSAANLVVGEPDKELTLYSLLSTTDDDSAPNVEWVNVDSASTVSDLLGRALTRGQRGVFQEWLTYMFKVPGSGDAGVLRLVGPLPTAA